MTNNRRALTDDDVDDFLSSAAERDDPLWADIEAYLTGELFRAFPFRATRLRKDIKWMRKRAAKAGLDWGKR